MIRIGFVDLGHHQPVGSLDLPPAERLVPQLPHSIDRVDGDHDLGDHDMMDKDRIGADCGDDRAGIGQPAGLQHDLVERPPRRTVRLRADRRSRSGDSASRAIAAGAAAGEHGKFGRAAEQRIVDRRLRRLVDDDEGVGERP